MMEEITKMAELLEREYSDDEDARILVRIYETMEAEGLYNSEDYEGLHIDMELFLADDRG